MRFRLALILGFLVNGIVHAADPTADAISTLAGSSFVGDNGPATQAILLQTEGLASDLKGNLYIADASTHRVRRLAPDGSITTVAGTGTRGFSGDGALATQAQLNSPYGLALDPRGNLYIADLGNARVRILTPDGLLHTLAGGGILPAGGPNEGSQAIAVALNSPRNLALDAAGNLYIADFGANRVYRLAPNGALTTAAGTGTPGSAGDGASATQAQLNSPAGLVLDPQGALYIADSGNHLVRKVSAGIIRSYARASTPTGLVLDALGTLYIADPSAGQIIKVPASPTTASTALKSQAVDLAFALDGSLYASSTTAVLRIPPVGVPQQIAGGGSLAYGDNGPAVQSRLNHPSGVAMDSSGNLYLADRDNHRIRRVTPGGIITTVAGTGTPGLSGDGAQAVFAQLNSPRSVTVDNSGTLYVADTGNHVVRKITADGKITTATNGGILSPVYALPDNAGNIYISDDTAGKLLVAGPNGVPATLATGLKSPRGLALDNSGVLYLAESGAAAVRRLNPDHTLTQIAPGSWQIPRGIAADSNGNLLVADTGLQQILEVSSSGQITVLAGTGTPGFSGDNGPAPAAQLGYPWDVALGPQGLAVIADLDNNRVRLLTPPAATLAPPAQLTTINSVIPTLVNAASLQPGPASPGMLMLLQNTGIDPTQIANAQLLFGPALARILSADSTGILLVAPPEIAGQSSANLEIFFNGVLQSTIPVAVADSSPALFANATGQATATNQDGTINSSSNPAPRGSIVSLYGTGLGLPSAPPTVTIAMLPSDVLYAGPVANYPGLFQINVTIPTGYLPSGQLQVSVSTPAATSQSAITIAVQ